MKKVQNEQLELIYKIANLLDEGWKISGLSFPPMSTLEIVKRAYKLGKKEKEQKK